jgi:hypothetical protein
MAVACRQADLDWSRPRESFLTALLNRLDPEAPESPDAVRFALRFLGDLAPGRRLWPPCPGCGNGSPANLPGPRSRKRPWPAAISKSWP